MKKSDPKTETEKRIARTEAYAEKVRQQFAQTVNSILALNKSMPKLDGGVMYSFDAQSMKMQKQVERLLRQLHSVATLAIRQGITLEWEQANTECDKLVQSCFGKKVLESTEFSAWTQRNGEARDAFINRTENGLNLSDRVWKNVKQLREEMEVAMTVAIGEGDSASSMSKKVREYLNDPDLMFRRFRYKDPDTGEWKRKWKKRVKDEATGKYKWIDYNRDDYKTGAGVYKSSAKNAMRVARTETNIAYRRADNERWQQLDFVLGQKIQLSRSHPCKDICDKLQGEYPKDFVFDGWHPQCFCFVTPILIDSSEMAKVTQAFLKGEKYTPKGKQVTTYPQGFKDWVAGHADQIAASRDRGTEPYFIKNNASVIDNILNPKEELSIEEIAAKRHAERTPEKEQQLREYWERKKAEGEARRKHEALVNKTANNVLNVAKDYGEIDYAELQEAVNVGDLARMETVMKSVAKSVSAMKKQEIALSDLIPDAHQWHKQFTMSELQGVHAAVEKKLQSWASLPLEQQAKKLKFEAYDYLGGNMYNVQSKYKTWEVSQKAYIRQLGTVQDKIDWNNINKEAAISKTFTTKSSVYNNLLGDLDAAIANSDKAKAQSLIAKLEAKKQELEKAAAKRNAKKGTTATETTFDADAYSKERKDAALWAKTKDSHGQYDRKAGDAYFRQFAEKDWQRWSENEKDVAYLYTSGSSYINEPLYTKYLSTKYGLKGEIRNSWDDINTLTKMIDESIPFTRDVWLNRGASLGEFKGQFGIDLYDYIGKEDGLKGSIGLQKAFTSTAHSKSWGFVDDGKKATRGVVYNIYCPKGTKGIYTEPYSAFGSKGRNWDGSTHNPLRNEVEVVLQRNTKFRVIKAEFDSRTDQWFIDMEVISQTL